MLRLTLLALAAFILLAQTGCCCMIEALLDDCGGGHSYDPCHHSHYHHCR